jgi:mutator protein MutT
MKQVIRVLAAVIERDGHWLVCRRPEHKRHGGLWEFPGGKMLPGESDADALARELAEELGVQAAPRNGSVYEIADPGSEFLIRFVYAAIAGEPSCLEHDEHRWAGPRDLRELPLAPSDRRFADEVLLGCGNP